MSLGPQNIAAPKALGIVSGLLILVAVIFAFSASSPSKARYDTVLEATLNLIKSRDNLIQDLARENRDNPKTHDILSKYGLNLGDDGVIYLKNGKSIQNQ